MEQLSLEFGGEENHSWQKMPALEDHLSFLLQDDCLKDIKTLYFANPNILVKNNFHFFSTACWIGKFEVVEFLLQQGALAFLENKEAVQEMEGLKFYNEDMYNFIHNYKKRRALYSELQKELKKTDVQSEFIKI